MIENLTVEEIQWISNCSLAVVFMLILVVGAYLKIITTRPPKL